MLITELPAIGQPLESGIFAGITSTVEGHFAVILLADKPAANLTWKKAMNWAEKVGGTLPSRPVAAMLFANLKHQFNPEWHWTCESFVSSGAWIQNFLYGYQYDSYESAELRSRAVRLIQLTA